MVVMEAQHFLCIQLTLVLLISNLKQYPEKKIYKLFTFNKLLD